MKFVLFSALIFAYFCSVSFASIPARNNLRFNQVDANSLGPNSVSSEDIQSYSVGRASLLNGAIYQSKMGPYAVNSDQVAPGAITSAGASLDLVKLYIKQTETIPAESQSSVVQIPEDVQAIQPHEAIADDGVVIVDNPDASLSYRVEGKARGSGVILGWYPSQNGHLLRYQSSRALRGLVCSAIDIESVNILTPCTCSNVVGTGQDGDTLTVDCSCEVIPQYVDTDFNSQLDCSSCTILDCTSDNRFDEDPMCTTGSVNQFENPLDDGDDDDNVPDFLPDRCSPYTSVEDVNNPQEGTPIYSPSVERITIDDTGRVEMRFFGAGTIDPAGHEPIEITVVVLLDDQYGA